MSEVHIKSTASVPVEEIYCGLKLILRGGSDRLEIATEKAKVPVELTPGGQREAVASYIKVLAWV